MLRIEIQQVEMTSKQVMHMNEKLDVSEEKSVQELRGQMQTDPAYQPTLQEKTILNIIEEVNKKLQGTDRELERSIHEKTNQVMIKVIDVNTKEVLKEFPPEKILDMVAAMCEQAGIFVDKKI